jgi:hypothetical protein
MTEMITELGAQVRSWGKRRTDLAALTNCSVQYSSYSGHYTRGDWESDRQHHQQYVA